LSEAAGRTAAPAQQADPRGVAFCLLSALSYGFAPVMAKLAYEAGAGVLTVTAGRFLMGALAIAALLTLGRRAWRLPARANWGAVGLGLATSVASLGYMAAVFYIPASLAVLIFYTFPLLVALGARWTEGEPITPVKLAGLCVAFVGLAVALGVSFGELDPRGVACAAAASVGAALHILAIGKVARWAGGAVLAVNVRSTTVGFAAMALLIAFDGGPQWPQGETGWFGLVATTVFFTGGITMMYAAVARIGPVRASMLFNFEPLVAIVAAIAVLGESFGAHQVVGAALVLGAVLWVQRSRRR